MIIFSDYFQAMHLVYRALDGEPVPSNLAPGLIPPSKRQIVTSTAIASSISSGGYSPRSVNSSSSVVGLFSFSKGRNSTFCYENLSVVTINHG